MDYSIREIDLKGEYRKSGEGATGSSYDCVADSSVMVKMFNPEYPREQIFTEVELARKVYDLGVPSPEPGELVTDGNLLGISFRRIVGKRSFSRMFADEPGRIEEFAREFAQYCRKLHSIECAPGLFADVKGQFLHLIDVDKVYTDAQKQVLVDFVNKTPDDNKALHGDLHFGNLISTLPFGAPLTDPHDLYFIDLGNFSQGNPLFDLGMVLMICLYCSDEFLYEAFHIRRPAAVRAWNAFADEYFDGRLTPQQADELIRPYEAIKTLLVEYASGALPPEYDRGIRDTFGF